MFDMTKIEECALRHKELVDDVDIVLSRATEYLRNARYTGNASVVIGEAEGGNDLVLSWNVTVLVVHDGQTAKQVYLADIDTKISAVNKLDDLIDQISRDVDRLTANYVGAEQ